MTTVSQSIIVQGEDRDIEFYLKDSSTGLPIDLTGVTEISAVTAGISGNVEFKLTDSEVIVVEAIHGQIKIIMSDIKTATMKVGTQNCEITVDWGAPTAGTRRIFQAISPFLVKQKLF